MRSSRDRSRLKWEDDRKVQFNTILPSSYCGPGIRRTNQYIAQCLAHSRYSKILTEIRKGGREGEKERRREEGREGGREEVCPRPQEKMDS